MNYVVISPVKDEERNILRTLESMVYQTVKPLVWVVIDDGSSDRTAELVQQYADQHPFIRLVRRGHRAARYTGVAEVLAFNAGYELVRNLEFDLIVKLDGDLSFEPDYFAQLSDRFRDNPELGIASGCYMEQCGEEWKEIPMPSYHAAGASKMVRRSCFDAIGGFISQRGWDTVDEIRARARGWETAHFAELKMKHWKPEGSGMGYLPTSYMQGEVHYRTGGGALFLLLKVFKRSASPPVITAGVAMFWGYLHNLIKRTERLVSPEEARSYCALLNRRILGKSDRYSPRSA